MDIYVENIAKIAFLFQHTERNETDIVERNTESFFVSVVQCTKTLVLVKASWTAKNLQTHKC